MDNTDRKWRILVVDDDPGFVKLVDGVLNSNGYEVITAQEAPAGLEIAMKESPDLIVLDVMMPIINGYNICRLMKSNDKCKQIPIILLTSRSGEEDKKIGEEVGADAYLAKPLNTEMLLGKVKELLGT